MSFTEQLWADIEPTYTAILAHPFLVELADGTLSRERFAFYMKQDALYLQDFSRSLAIAGGRTPVTADMEGLLASAHGAIVVERALHETYFREFGVTLDVDQSPSCFAYTRFLVAAAATAPYPEAVAALLPCFWIYREVGLDVHRRAAGGLAANPYARWIEQYAGEAFGVSVARAIALTERVAATANEEDRLLMRRAFDRSARLEWLFWDSAYRIEEWPPLP